MCQVANVRRSERESRVTRGERQAIALGLPGHLAPGKARFQPRDAPRWVDGNGLHAREINHDPPSVVLYPAILWPPLRTATARPCCCAKVTAAMTSAASTQRTMRAGWRSNAPFQTPRALSYASVPGMMSCPCSRVYKFLIVSSFSIELSIVFISFLSCSPFPQRIERTKQV